MIRNFTNDELDLADERGIEMALSILDHMRDKMRIYQNKPEFV